MEANHDEAGTYGRYRCAVSRSYRCPALTRIREARGRSLRGSTEQNRSSVRRPDRICRVKFNDLTLCIPIRITVSARSLGRRVRAEAPQGSPASRCPSTRPPGRRHLASEIEDCSPSGLRWKNLKVKTIRVRASFLKLRGRPHVSPLTLVPHGTPRFCSPTPESPIQGLYLSRERSYTRRDFPEVAPRGGNITT